MKSEFEIAITQLSADRNLSPQIILEAIEAALVSAYKRNYGSTQNARVNIDPHTGQARVYVKKVVVEDVEDDNLEISLDDAVAMDLNVGVDDFVDIEVKPRNFGRIAAQTAKQVITQRIREAERDSVYAEYAERVGEIVNGIVRNVDARSNDVVLSLGKAEVLLPRNEQIPREHYRFNQRLRVLIVGVDKAGHGPQIRVSRSHPDLLRRLLELEVPEVFNGIVEIKAISREPGFRSKVAVTALQPGVDPVGSCVGMRGVRIRNIVNELNGEKIDVVAWSPDVREFIANSLSPARVVSVYLNEVDKTATVVVPDRSLSLAIGKEGQNARLAAKLSGWRIDIKSETEAVQEAERLAVERAEAEAKAREMEDARRAAAELLAQAEEAMAAEELVEEPGDGDEVLLEEDAEPVVDEDLGIELVDEAQEPPAVLPEEVALDELPEEDVVLDEEVEPEAQETSDLEVETIPEDEAPETQPEAIETLSAEADEEAVVEDEDAVIQEGVEPEEADVEESAEADIESVEEDSPQPVAEALEEPEDWDEDDDESGGGSSRRRRRRRDRRLVFDEELGRVVARKRHKPGRRSWEDTLDDPEWG